MRTNKRIESNRSKKKVKVSDEVTEFRGNRKLFEYSTKEFPQELVNMERATRQVDKYIREQQMYGK